MRNQNWTWLRLGELFEIGAGKTMSARARTGSYQVPFLRTSNVLWDEIDLSSVDTMSLSPTELQEKLLRSGDLLVCEGGDIGRSAVWANDINGPVSFQNHLHRLRPLTNHIYPRFYVYFLQSAFTQLGLFEGSGNTTTIPNLSRNRLAALEVPSPDIGEQVSIVSTLALVRSAITTNDALLTKTSELRSSVMHELFTRGLRGEGQKDSPIGLIPESWRVISLGDLGRVGNGSTPRKGYAPFWTGGHYSWLTSAKVYDREIVAADQFVTQTALDECHLPKVKPGSILIAITGQGKTLGHCAVLRIEATVNQHIAYVSIDDQKAARPSFVRGFLETRYEYLRQIASGGGSTKGALTCSFLREMKIPMPPDTHDGRAEQSEIVEILDAIDRKIELHKKKRSVLEALFQSLLHKLMTGEIAIGALDLYALSSASSASTTVERLT